MSWCDCARSASLQANKSERDSSLCPASRRAFSFLTAAGLPAPPLFDHFVGINAPEQMLLDIAVEALTENPAPLLVAASHGAEHLRPELRDDARTSVGPLIECERFRLRRRRYQRRAPARQQRMEHPS